MVRFTVNTSNQTVCKTVEVLADWCSYLSQYTFYLYRAATVSGRVQVGSASSGVQSALAEAIAAKKDCAKNSNVWPHPLASPPPSGANADRTGSRRLILVGKSPDSAQLDWNQTRQDQEATAQQRRYPKGLRAGSTNSPCAARKSKRKSKPILIASND